MLFVFLAHFTEVYFYRSEGHNIALGFLYAVSMIASPTFIAISGLMLGFIYRTNRDNFRNIKAKLIDRGLFLLIIGHFITSLSRIPLRGSLINALRSVFITDTIGFSIIMGALLIERIKPANRVLLSLFIYLFSWLVILFMHSENLAFRILKDAFFGPYLMENIYNYTFPILPWFSFYFLNSFIGEKMAIYYEKKEGGKISKMLFIIAFSGLLMAFCIKASYHASHTCNLLPKNLMIYKLTSPFQKAPPSPAYFLWYGGVGFFIIYILSKFGNKWIINKFAEIMKVLGRTSLFVFMLQFYVYYVFFYCMNLPYTAFWPIYFLISSIIIIAIANVWHKNNLNRILTLGSVDFFARKFEKHLRNGGKINSPPNRFLANYWHGMKKVYRYMF